MFEITARAQCPDLTIIRTLHIHHRLTHVSVHIVLPLRMMPTGNVFSPPNMIRKLFIFFFRYSTAGGLLDEAGDGDGGCHAAWLFCSWMKLHLSPSLQNPCWKKVQGRVLWRPNGLGPWNSPLKMIKGMLMAWSESKGLEGIKK